MNENSFIFSNIDSYTLPKFGYKIHVSATWKNFREVKESLIPILEDKKVAYKYLKDDKEVWTNFSVYESLAESGKLFTIYPKNHQEFLELLELLYEQLPKELEGIYIVSDRPYKDSNIIFYRYGTMNLDIKQTRDGHPILYGPNGEEWQDYQKTYFDLPVWIEDIQPDDTIEESYLSLTYGVEAIKKSSNGGNVYHAWRLSDNKQVILKESRPHILYFEELEKRSLRENEYRYCRKLDRYVPKAIEKVNEWQHIYYIYSRVKGEDFYSQSRKYNLFAYQSLSTEDFQQNLKKFKLFLELLDKLFDLVLYFHTNDVILNDIHPDNFVVDPSGDIYFVDLEHVYDYQDKPSSGVYHEIALKSWCQLDGKVSDCHKIANMILYSLGKLQVNNLSEVSDKNDILEKLLEQYGISTPLSNLIYYLFSPGASMDVAKVILSVIKAETVLSHQAYELDFSSLEKSQTEVSFLERVKQINKTLSKYKKSLINRDLFFYEVDKETSFGLSGLLGSLVLLKAFLSEEFLDYGLNKVKSGLVETEYGDVLSVGNNSASPYFDTGNAGYIQALIYFDKEKYLTEIVELADTFKFELAQRAGYNDGMLGIVDSLLQVYDLTTDTKYLRRARILLLNTSFYVRYGEASSSDFEVLFHKFKERELNDVKHY